MSDSTIICDIVYWDLVKIRHTLFDSLHRLSHPGIRATQYLYIWPRIKSNICQWAHTCLKCQRENIHLHTTLPLGTFATPNARFDHIQINLVGPHPPSSGCVDVFTCINCFTWWPEAIPIAGSHAQTVARVIVSRG